jgi:hypothetical protein
VGGEEECGGRSVGERRLFVSQGRMLMGGEGFLHPSTACMHACMAATHHAPGSACRREAFQQPTSPGPSFRQGGLAPI